MILTAIDLITDLHLKEKIISYQIKDIYRLKSESTMNNKEQILFILGDIFDERLKANSFLLVTFKEILIELKKKYKAIFLITGNHDKEHDDVVYSFNTIYNFIEGIEVFDDFGYADVTKYGFETDHKFLCAPFFSDAIWFEKLKDYIPKDDDNKTILLGHKTISGFNLNSYKKTEGLNFEKILNKFKRVFLGDLHLRQKRGNIYFIGSFMQENFGDDNNKGSLRYFLEKDRLKKIIVATRLFTTLYFDLSIIKKEDIFDFVSKKIEKVKSPFLKLVFKGRLEQTLSVPENQLRLQYSGNFEQIKISFDIIQESKKNKFEVQDNKTFFEQDFKEYCLKENMSELQIKYGEELLKIAN